MSFDELSLHPKLLESVIKAGYTTPTEIQKKAIPVISEGSDIKASAQTGTGKTAAFLLPALNRLVLDKEKNTKGPQILILAPTRELALQIATQAEKYSKYLKDIKTVCVCGGVPYHSQMRKLSKPYDVLIATPGRLIDYLNRRKVNFSSLKILVLDEADRMLDIGFLEPVEKIVAATPASRQILLFSATMPKSVKKLSEKLLKDPVEIIIHAEHDKHENIDQKIFYADDLHHKNRLLDHILADKEINSAIIFTATKRHADLLVDDLFNKGHRTEVLHGDINQRKRIRTIQNLKIGKTKILVATDVAARGIDVKSITHVINFDLPRHIEDYVHRIGRTGRAGEKGTALSFVSRSDSILVKKIEQFTGQSINIEVIPGLEPSKKASQRPLKRAPKNRPNRNFKFKKRRPTR
jgi:superfamily II DNA/RNA helicase